MYCFAVIDYFAWGFMLVLLAIAFGLTFRSDPDKKKEKPSGREDPS